ncbi:substrate-binding domain-containing protein [Paenibacillus sp. JX-17]|uniref:Substrate-binding domain-containing protein n=1 Tax=Paenibacillus lacisoli TaxID=3064525 RepID=A0ABT9C6V0_9BACL|nr:substrate-binding domain-containing protein [Paenibacillus sp. JX-17]MDO7904997.1 substrate-binding domain-containing protein [Paenibacillus sp. JX-17]
MISKGVRLIVGVLLLCLCGSCSPASSSMLVTAGAPLNVDMIVKMKGGEYWNTIRMGAEVAAKEFNVHLTIKGPQSENDIKGQIRLMDESIQQKKDAIILSASDYMQLAQVTDRADYYHIPVISMDAEVASAKPLSYIGANNYESGQLGAERLVQLTGKSGEIAIINFVKGARNADQRLEGMLDYIARYPQLKVVDIQYCGSDEELAYREAMQMLKLHPQLKGIAALNAVAAVGAGRAIEDTPDANVKVVTFDSLPDVMEMLQEGTVQATVIQNPFSNGYLAVKNAVEAARGIQIPERVDTGTKLIDRSNMFWPENQKQMFPFVK